MARRRGMMVGLAGGLDRLLIKLFLLSMVGDKEGRFISKDLFKGFARHLSHLLAQKLSPGRSVKEEAQSLIKQFFHNRARCESEADWHGLCGPQR